MLCLKTKSFFSPAVPVASGVIAPKLTPPQGRRSSLLPVIRRESEKVAAELGPDHLGIVCDVTRDDDVKAAVEKSLSRYGRLNAVHNNAGISHPSKPIHETTDAEWNALFDVNLKGVLHTTRHAFPALVASKGCVLNTSSLVGVIGQEIHAAYTATKGGLNALTKSMALDYARHGIRVNAVCPAGAWTPMLRQWCEEQPDPDSMERVLERNPSTGLLPRRQQPLPMPASFCFRTRRVSSPATSCTSAAAQNSVIAGRFDP